MNSDKNINESLQSLTDMERKILALIAENKTSKEIAEILFISYRTVQNHRYNIGQKLDLKGSNKLLEFAINNKTLLTDFLPVNFESTGPVQLKGKSGTTYRLIAVILFTVLLTVFAVYWFSSGNFLSSSTQNSHQMLTNKNRIAVLPFRLIGPDTSEEYLSEGLTEELITQISQIPELRVIARSSVIRFKNNFSNLSEIAEELNVSSILEGSVQKADDNIRVNVQLIDTESKENLWSQTFDRKFSDILSIQKEIAWQVALALKVELFLAGLDAADKSREINEEAHLAYLKGRYFVNQATKESFQKAIELFTQSIHFDSNYAVAWAGLADAYIWQANYGYMNPHQAFSFSKKAVTKALELEPDLSDAYTSKASINLLYDWDFISAETEFLKALSLNPSDVNAHRLYALLQFAVGKPEKAVEHTQIALNLDPLSVLSNSFHGRAYYFSGQYDKAVEQYHNTTELDENFWLVYSFLGEAYLELNKNTKAISVLKKAVELSPDNYIALARLGYGYARTGAKTDAEKIIQELILNSDDGKALSFQIALIYTAIGKKDDAFEWIQKAYDNKHDFMLDLQSDPKLDPLRNDDRFNTFLIKMGLG
jgi:TolB-like protein/DNA-binding CsgD family transcriptional regulator/Tfp pilus assembly protein PilF